MSPTVSNLASATGFLVEEGLPSSAIDEEANTHPVITDLRQLAANNDHFARKANAGIPPRLRDERLTRVGSRWASELPDLPEAKRAALAKLEEDGSNGYRMLYAQHILRELWLLRLAVPNQIPDLAQHLLSSSANPVHLAAFVLELSALRLIATHPQCENCAIQVKHSFDGGKMEIDVFAQMGGETVLAEVTMGEQKSADTRQMQRLFALTDALDRTRRARLYCVFGVFGKAAVIPNWRATHNVPRPMTLVEFHKRLISDWGPYGVTDEPERVLEVSVSSEILDRAPIRIFTPELVSRWYHEARRKIPRGELRDNMALTSCAIEAHFVATRGMFFWQDLAIYLWKMVADCTSGAEACEKLGLIDAWVREKNFAALENFYRLTVEEPGKICR